MPHDTHMNILRTFAVLSACLFVTCVAAETVTPPVEGKHPAPVILVAPFENLSGTIIDIAPDDTVRAPRPDVEVVISTQPRPTERKVIADRLVDAPRAVLEDLIVNLKGTTGSAKVVERSRADGLFTEGISPEQARDPKTAIRFAQATGATAIALGTITQLASANGRMTAEVRIRLVSAEGNVTYSQLLHGESNASEGGDAYFSAVRAALKSLEQDTDFRAQIVPDGGAAVVGEATIEVLVQPSESRCELEIDGVFVGTTPGRFPFPAGRKIRVRISKAGFEPWDKTVVATKDLRLTPELAPARR